MSDRIWICRRRLHLSTLPASRCVECGLIAKRHVEMVPYLPESVVRESAPANARRAA